MEAQQGKRTTGYFSNAMSMPSAATSNQNPSASPTTHVEELHENPVWLRTILEHFNFSSPSPQLTRWQESGVSATRLTPRLTKETQSSLIGIFYWFVVIVRIVHMYPFLSPFLGFSFLNSQVDNCVDSMIMSLIKLKICAFIFIWVTPFLLIII